MTACYITGMELYDEGRLQAGIQADDVCWVVDLKDKTHTPESWVALAADIGAAMTFANDHNNAQDLAKREQQPQQKAPACSAT